MMCDLKWATNGYGTTQRWRLRDQCRNWSRRGRREAISSQRHAANDKEGWTRGNHTLDGSPGIKQCNFSWPGWEFYGSSGHCSERGHLVQEHIVETGRTKKSNTLWGSALRKGMQNTWSLYCTTNAGKTNWTFINMLQWYRTCCCKLGLGKIQ